jgi:hypothetical protein
VASKPIGTRESPAAPATAQTREPIKPPASRPRRNHILVEAVLVLAGYTALALWLTWPLSKDFEGSIYGYPGDSTGTIALLSWLADKVGYHVVGTTHLSFTGAPFGTEFPNALNIQWALLFAPGTLATKLVGEVAAYNLLVVSGLALSGSAMYLLMRSLGSLPPVAAWAGLVYTIFPWHLEKAQGHVGFVHLQGFPLLVLAVLAWHRNPTFSRALLVAGASLLLWMTAGYFGVLGSVSLCVLLLVVFVFHRHRLGTRRALGRLSLAGAFTLAVPVLIYGLSVAGNPKGVGNPRTPEELFIYGARPWEYVLPSYRNPAFGDDVGTWLAAHLHGSNFSETTLFVGWLTITLAMAWLVWALLRRRSLTADLALLAVALPVLIVVAGVFSLPSPIPRTDIATPGRVLWELAPQFRVPARFVVVVMTGLVCLAALGLGALCAAVARSVRRPGLAGLLAGGVCAAAAAVSLIELPLEASPATTNVSILPPYYKAVRAAPPGILAEYPLAHADQAVNSDYLFWQRKHGRRLLNGAQLGTFADAVGQALADPASPETPAALAALGVSVVVVRPTTYSLTGGPSELPPLVRGYRQLGSEAGSVVWEVTAPPAPAVAAFKDGFGPTETPPGSRAGRWLYSDSGTVDLYARRAGAYRARFRVSSHGRFRVVRIRGDQDFRLVSVARERMIEIPLRLPRGHSHLVLDARPGTEQIPDGRHVSIYVWNWQITPVRGRPRSEPLEPFPGESG